MDEKRSCKKREPKAKKPPPAAGVWVVCLTHRRKLGAPVYLAPSPGLAPSKSRLITSKIRYAAQFPSESEAKRFARFFNHPDYVNTPWFYTEEKPRPIKKASGVRQRLMTYMRDDDV